LQARRYEEQAERERRAKGKASNQGLALQLHYKRLVEDEAKVNSCPCAHCTTLAARREGVGAECRAVCAAGTHEFVWVAKEGAALERVEGRRVTGRSWGEAGESKVMSDTKFWEVAV